MKILIAPIEVSGYYACLAKGLVEVGAECDYITYTRHPFDYGGQARLPALIYLANYFNGLRGKSGGPALVKALIALSGIVCQNIWGIYAIFRYDVFIFGFGHTLLAKSLDLIILRILKKVVICNIGHGTDARLPYIDGTYQSKDKSEQPTVKQLIGACTSKFKQVAAIEKYSTAVLGAPLSTSHLSRKKFINWFAIGVPLAFSDTKDSSTGTCIRGNLTKSSRCIRILHSPSHPAAKGSTLIVKAINRLILKGHQIDLVLLQNRPHSEVIHEIQRCDFVVDQVYSDTPLAGFASEAAWFGKPAVIGGYGFDYLKEFVPNGMWPPSVTCHPDKIEQAIEDLIVNEEKRLQLGALVQRFVREKWNAAAVARRYLRVIHGDIPEEWWLNPNIVIYLEGVGQPIERTQENIRQMVATFGSRSLKLTHRPDLEYAFLKFAGFKDVC